MAAARCAKSLEVGAKPLLIAPQTAELHYALQKRIDNGEVEWLKKSFEDEDVLRLGREEINGVVDAVFVTLGPRDPLSRELPNILDLANILKAHTSPNFADETEYQSTYPMLPPSAPSASSPHIPTDPSRLA